MLIVIPTNAFQIARERMSTCLTVRQFALIYVLLDSSWKIAPKDVKLPARLDLLSQLPGTASKDALEMFRLLAKIRSVTTHV